MEEADNEPVPSKEQLEAWLKIMDKGGPEGTVRTAVRLGTDENGNALGVIVWRKEYTWR